MKPFNELNPTELNVLGGNFRVYRDRFCNGWAKMSIQEFYKKFEFKEYKNLAGACASKDAT